MSILDLKPNKINNAVNNKIFLFYGEQETWKTTMGTKFPGHIIAAFEIGYQFIDGAIGYPINTWYDFTLMLRELDTPAAKERYKTVVIDTIGLCYRSCYKAVCDREEVKDPGEIGFGKGWRAIKDEFERAIYSITQMGYCLVMLAHATEKETVEEFINPNTNKIEKRNNIVVKIDIDKSPAALIKGMSDLILYCRKEYDDDGNPSVFAYSNLQNIETKRRPRYFPERILFTYGELIKGLDYAVKKQAEEEKLGYQVETEDIENGDNVHKAEEINLEVLQNEVKELIVSMWDSSAEEYIDKYLTDNFGELKISETKKIHIPKLLAAKDYLLALKEKMTE